MQEHVFDGRLKHHSVIKLLPCGLSYHESESSELQDLRCGFKIAASMVGILNVFWRPSTHGMKS